jgi:hypothetical protein
MGEEKSAAPRGIVLAVKRPATVDRTRQDVALERIE